MGAEEATGNSRDFTISDSSQGAPPNLYLIPKTTNQQWGQLYPFTSTFYPKLWLRIEPKRRTFSTVKWIQNVTWLCENRDVSLIQYAEKRLKKQNLLLYSIQLWRKLWHSNSSGNFFFQPQSRNQIWPESSLHNSRSSSRRVVAIPTRTLFYVAPPRRCCSRCFKGQWLKKAVACQFSFELAVEGLPTKWSLLAQFTL